MSLRLPLRPVLAGSLALALAACGGAPAAPALSDPVDILVKSVESLREVKSFHVDVDVSGELNVDMFGTGSASGLDLANTTASADVDVENGNAHLEFAAPSLLGIEGELIQIGTTSYTRVSLMGDSFTRSESEDIPTDPDEITDEDLAELRTELSKPEVAPTKGDDVDCGDKRCYAVVFDLTAAELQDLGGELPTDELPVDVGEGSVKLTVHVEQDTLRPAALLVDADAGQDGSIQVEVTLSGWDQPVSISAPPADQVQG